jgi:hypothetical protein
MVIVPPDRTVGAQENLQPFPIGHSFNFFQLLRWAHALVREAEL